jgi:hypothetical protein
MNVLPLLLQRGWERMTGLRWGARSRQTLLMSIAVLTSFAIAYSDLAPTRSDEAVHPSASETRVIAQAEIARERARGSGHPRPVPEGLKEKRGGTETARAPLSV